MAGSKYSSSSTRTQTINHHVRLRCAPGNISALHREHWTLEISHMRVLRDGGHSRFYCVCKGSGHTVPMLRRFKEGASKQELQVSRAEDE